MKIKNTTKRASWIVAAFYLLIIFEFFYMASPFAVYFYSIYKPGLSIFSYFPSISWLTDFFLPHIAEETKSPILNSLNYIGSILFAFGLFAFFICAFQVYYFKIFKKQAVTKGLYAVIRHPQYAAFALSGFGMLLIWPRFLVLIMFISMLFIYYFLAKIEEKECESKFGDSYIAYKNKTFMFFPFKIPFSKSILFKNIQKPYKYFVYIALYFVIVISSVFIAQQIRKLSVNYLYFTTQNNSVNLSINELTNEQITEIMQIAQNNSIVDSLISPYKDTPNIFMLNYILPAQIFNISEIPMEIPQIMDNNSAKIENKETIKVVFTKAITKNIDLENANQILLHTKSTQAIVEVWLDMHTKEIKRIIFPQKTNRYENIPVPVF